MPRRVLFLLFALTLAAAPGLAVAAPIAISTFDTGAENWTAVGDPTSATPRWHAAGGNPGAHIQVVDAVRGDGVFWKAPPKFLGNVSAAYGRTLTFDLAQSALDAQGYGGPDVALVGGAAGREFAIVTRLSNPRAVWTRYTVRLDETAGWKKAGSGLTATRDEFRAVLSRLLTLRIRAEYRTGADTDALDNVVLNGPDLLSLEIPSPVPASLPVTARIVLDRLAATDLDVGLTSSHASAVVPAGVRILKGRDRVEFTIATRAVPSPTFCTITARYGNLVRTEGMTLRGPGVKSLTVAPATFTGAGRGVGTVTLECVAPQAQVVTLWSGHGAVWGPGGSVTVPAGYSSVQFPFFVDPVPALTRVPAEAASNGVAAFTALTLNASAPAASVVAVANVAGRIGGTIELQANLRRRLDNLPLPGRKVIFKVGGVLVGPAAGVLTGQGGNATQRYQIPEGAGPGIRTFTAEFLGGTAYSPSSATGTLTVSKTGTNVHVPNKSALPGQTVVLQARLRRGTDGAVLAGRKLVFKINGTVYGPATGVATNAEGWAEISLTVPPAAARGNRTVSAHFAGDASYGPGSGSGTLTVN